MAVVLKKVALFGGSGFVGSEIISQLLTGGHEVVSFTRNPESKASKDNLNWYKADGFDPKTYINVLKETKCDSVIISVGAPPTPTFSENAYKVKFDNNGTVCRKIIETCNESGIKKVVLINATLPSWAPSAYVKGKLEALNAAKEYESSSANNGAIVLFPAAINGTRKVGNFSIPLWPILSPLSYLIKGIRASGIAEKLEKTSPKLFVGVLEPMVPVELVAKVAVESATQDKYNKTFTNFTNQDILNYKV